MRTEEEEKKLYNQYRTVLQAINPPKDSKTGLDYPKENYYGTGMYKQKKDGKFCFYLIYDYSTSKNALKSSTIAFDNIEDVLTVIRVMESFAVNKSAVISVKFDINNPDTFEKASSQQQPKKFF